MSEEKRIAELDEYEHRAVVNILNEKRNETIEKNRDAEFISEILEKLINAPKKKNLFNKKENRDER